MECIRLHYTGATNPMATLDRRADFMALFEDLIGYVDFFLLQDLVSKDGSVVMPFMPFDGFEAPALPASVETCRDYRQNAIGFVKARDRRMAKYVAGR